MDRFIPQIHPISRKVYKFIACELGSADEQKPPKEGMVEAWGKSPKNQIGGWYGLKKGLRGRFGMYIPPLMEELGLAEIEHNAKDNRMRAK